MRSTNPAARGTAALTFCVMLVFSVTTGATSVDKFLNGMSDDAQQAYVLTMAAAAERVLNDAGKPQAARQVHALFAGAGRGSGSADAVEKFMDTVDEFLRNEIVNDVAGTASQDGPFKVEEMMVTFLKQRRIELPPAFMAMAKAGKMQETPRASQPSGANGTAAATPTPPASSRRSGASPTTRGSTSTPPPSERNAANARAGATIPALVWHPDAKNPKTVLKAGEVMVKWNPAHFVAAEAVCASNGASVSFEIHGDDNKVGPMFESHVDPTSKGDDLVADVPIRIDGQSHVSKAWLTRVKDANVVNEMGVLFYEPGIAARVRGEQRLLVRGLGDLTGAIVGGAADADAEEGIRTSAGPLSDLVNARSIRVELPVQQGSYSAALELNPQDQVLHEFAVRCYEHFGGQTTPQTRSRPSAAPSK